MKKIIFIFTTIFLLSSNAFATFELNLQIPVGLSYILPYTDGGHLDLIGNISGLEQYKPFPANYEDLKDTYLYGVGVLMQIGYAFQLNNQTGVTSISLFADIGYCLQPFGAIFQEAHRWKHEYDYNGYLAEEVILLHNLNLGVLYKLNIYIPGANPFSIGLGFGAKIPFGGTRYRTMSSGEETKDNLSYQDIKDIFVTDFIPYVKLTADVYLYVSKKIAITIGANIAYNFSVKHNVNKINSEGSTTPPIFQDKHPVELTKYGYSSLDIGISIGFYFGRENPKQQ